MAPERPPPSVMQTAPDRPEDAADPLRSEPGAYRYYVLLLLALAYAFSFMDRNIVSILLGDLKAEFDLNDTQLGLLSGLAFALFYSTFAIPIARYADRSNRTLIVSIAVAVWSLVTAACAVVSNFTQLLLCRVGVGIGEAGGLSPSHSIISDYFRREERSLAISLFSLGATVGAFAGVVMGGIVAENYGWRAAFLVAGLPGVLLAILLKLTVREPLRGGMDGQDADASDDQATTASFFRTAQTLAGNRVYRGTVAAHVLAVFSSYSITAWLPQVFLRNFDVSQSLVGTLVGVVFLCGAAVGMVSGGWLATHMARIRSGRWELLVPAIGVALSVPIHLLALTALGSIYVCAALFMLGAFFFAWQHGPGLAVVQNAVAPEQRATAASLNFFLSNLLGLGLGPLLVGSISDQLADRYGDVSLNIALGVVVLVSISAAVMFYRVSRLIDQ